MPDRFPLLLKEGWPDHFLVMIQILIPAGVVDCYSNSGFSLMMVFLISFFTNLISGILICFKEITESTTPVGKENILYMR